MADRETAAAVGSGPADGSNVPSGPGGPARSARYGVRPAQAAGPAWPRRLLVIVLGVAFAAGTGFVTYLTFRNVTHQEVAGSLLGFEIVDESTMRVDFTVARDDPSRAAVCIIRARSRDGSETGRRELYVAPSASSTVRVVAEVKTSQPPGVGDVYGCGYDVPGYLVP